MRVFFYVVVRAHFIAEPLNYAGNDSRSKIRSSTDYLPSNRCPLTPPSNSSTNIPLRTLRHPVPPKPLFLVSPLNTRYQRSTTPLLPVLTTRRIHRFRGSRGLTRLHCHPRVADKLSHPTPRHLHRRKHAGSRILLRDNHPMEDVPKLEIRTTLNVCEQHRTTSNNAVSSRSMPNSSYARIGGVANAMLFVNHH